VLYLALVRKPREVLEGPAAAEQAPDGGAAESEPAAEPAEDADTHETDTHETGKPDTGKPDTGKPDAEEQDAEKEEAGEQEKDPAEAGDRSS
jgi:hypothetical protein